ncbi:MAG: MBL fold metallo-hydrolase [Kistimonas sp.]|nr:MBL fold metallo-hydrolase [Kistimonas sp.]
MHTKKAQALVRESFPVGPLRCNCTIVGDPATGRCLVIDPGGDAQIILDKVQTLGLTIVALIHTHAHFDHFLASGELKEKTGASVHLHKADKFLWDNLEMQCQLFGVPYQPAPAPDFWLQDDDPLPCCDGVCMHTPGHSPGSMCFHFERDNLLIAGDTLFRRSVGRTDLWGGDYASIEKSIRGRLYTLDEDTLVVTGHGPETSIGEELRENAVIRG